MAHLDVQSKSLQVPLNLVQLELKIELERLEIIEIFWNGYFHWQGQKRQKNNKGDRPANQWMDKQYRVELHSTQLKNCSNFKKVSDK